MPRGAHLYRSLLRDRLLASARSSRAPPLRRPRCRPLPPETACYKSDLAASRGRQGGGDGPRGSSFAPDRKPAKSDEGGVQTASIKALQQVLEANLTWRSYLEGSVDWPPRPRQQPSGPQGKGGNDEPDFIPGRMTAVADRIAKNARTASVERIMKMIEDTGLTLRRKAFTMAIAACGKARESGKALELFHKMIERGNEPDVIAYGALTYAFRSAGEWERALWAIRDMEKRRLRPNHTVYNNTLAAYGCGGGYEQARALVQEMRGQGVEPDTISYNILINTAVEVGELEELPVLVQEMEEAGVEADHHTYAALMGGYAKAGRPAGALAFLEVMQDRGLKPDVHCYNNALLACSRAGDFEGAARLLDDIVYSESEELLAGTLTPLIKACTEMGHVEEGKRLVERAIHSRIIGRSGPLDAACTHFAVLTKDPSLLKRLWAAGLSAHSVAYGNLLQGFRDARMWSEVLAVGDEMRKREVPRRTYHFNMLMAGLQHYSRGGEAAALYREMREVGVEPDAYTFSFGIDASVRARAIVDALYLLRESETSKLKPEERYPLYVRAAKGAAMLGQWQTLMSLLAGMRAKGITPRVELYALAISAFAKNGALNGALTVLGNLEKGQYREVVPNTACYNAALDAASRQGLAPLVMELYQRLLDRRLEPDAFTFCTAISGCARAGDSRTAHKLMQDMLERGVEPSMPFYGAMVNACVKAGELDAACKYFYEAEATMAPLSTILYSSLMTGFGDAGKWPSVMYLFEDVSLLTGPDASVLRCVGRSMEEPEMVPMLRAAYERTLAEGGITHWSRRSVSAMDLHYFSRSLVRVALASALEEVEAGKGVGARGLTVVVGYSGEVVLEEIKRSLAEDFDPPLEYSLSGRNTGRILILRDSIDRWLAARGSPPSRLDMSASEAFSRPTPRVMRGEPRGRR